MLELLNNNVPLAAQAIGAVDQCPAFGQGVVGLADIGWPHRGAGIRAGLELRLYPRATHQAPLSLHHPQASYWQQLLKQLA